MTAPTIAHQNASAATSSPAQPVPHMLNKGILSTAQENGWAVNKHGNWHFALCHPDGSTPIDSPFAYYNRTTAGWDYIVPTGCKVRFYLRPGFLEAIKQVGGVVYLVGGCTDVLSMIAAGYLNVFSMLNGETSIPQNIAATLRRWEVTRIIYFPDNDRTGTKALAKLAGLLEGSGIKLAARAIPGDAKDVNELWASLAAIHTDSAHSAKTLFRQMLNSAQRLEVQPDASAAATTDTPPAQPITATTSAADYSDHQRSIVESLGVVWRPGGHKSQPLQCPFHDDQEPSAVLFSNAGDSGLFTLYCSVCGEFKQTELVDKLNLKHGDSPPDNYRLSGSIGVADVGMRVQGDDDDLSILALPVDLRSSLLSSKHSNLARFIEYSWRCELRPGKYYTTAEWQSKVSAQFKKTAVSDFFRKNDSFFSVSVFIGTKSGKNTRGRPKNHYQVPTLAKIAELCGISAHTNTPPTPLPDSAFDSAKAYRMAAHLARVQANCENWKETERYPKTKTLSKNLGVTPRTLCRYEKAQMEAEQLRKESRPIWGRVVPEGYILTDEDKKQGWKHIEFCPDEGIYRLKTYNTSEREFIRQNTTKHDTPQPDRDGSDQLTSDQDPPQPIDGEPPRPAHQEPPEPEPEQEPHNKTPKNSKTDGSQSVAMRQAQHQSDPHKVYCRNCGQQPMFPDKPPRVCDFCGAAGGDLWHDTPPDVPPEVLRERTAAGRLNLSKPYILPNLQTKKGTS